ncbi:MAG: hypothetical protein WB786_03215 [Thermoplasmata archaeon]
MSELEATVVATYSLIDDVAYADVGRAGIGVGIQNQKIVKITAA